MTATTVSAADNGQPKAPEFFKLNGRYSIDETTTRDELAEDAFSLLSSGLGVLEAIDYDLVEGGDGRGPKANAYWCAIYSLRQARALVERLAALS
jgi:hypothetical protein